MPKELEDLHDEGRDKTGDVEDSAGEVGQGYQEVDQAKDDYNDDDQDARDKSRNMADGGTDALDHGGKALEALGIDDPGLQDLAKDIDGFMDEAMGREPPDVLPTTVCRIYFGKKSTVDSLKDSALDSAVGLGDAAAGALLDEVGLGEMGKETVSSFLEDHEPAEGASKWNVLGARLSEGLSDLFRCELLLVRPEVKDQAAEDALAAQNDGGGLLSGITSVYDNAKAVGETVAGAVDDVVGTAEELLEDPGDALSDIAEGLIPIDEAGDTTDPKINIPLDPAEYLGKTLSIGFTREMTPDPYPYGRRWLTGIIAEMTDLGVRREPTDQQGNRMLRLVIVPSLHKLTLRKDCRVFQEVNALDVVREVLRSAGLYGLLPDAPGVGAATDAISGAVSGALSEISGAAGGAAGDLLGGQLIKTLPPDGKTEEKWTLEREMCVQYNETDYDFMRRLLEEEGISFFFEGEQGIERIVFCDHPGTLPSCDTIDGRAVPYFFPYAASATPPKVEGVKRLRQGARLHTNKVTLSDFNFCDVPLQPTRLVAESAEGKDDLEVHEHPARTVLRYSEEEQDKIHYLRYSGDEKYGDRDLAKLRLEEHLTRRIGGDAQSDVTALRPGTTLLLKGVRFAQRPDEEEKSHTLLVEKVEHRWGVATTALGRLGPAIAGTFLGGGSYSNVFQYRWVDPDDPAKTPYRPARVTPRPLIRGVQTATVVDSDGDDCDDQRLVVDAPTLKRIRVRFHWDRRGETAMNLDLPLLDRGKSAWVRVAEPTAGNDWGCVFTPRGGMEVVVGFLSGDPDRPVVLGAVYNGDNPPPLPSEDVVRSILKTWSEPDSSDAKSNELVLDDTHGKEKVSIVAAKFLVEEVRTAHETKVEGAQKNVVKGAHGEQIEKRQLMTVHGDRDKTVKSDERNKVEGDRIERVGGKAVTLVFAGRKEKVDGKERVRIGDPDAEVPDIIRTLVINGSRETHIGDHTPPPDPMVKDVHDVGVSKTDIIVGDLEIKAKGFSIGGKDAGVGLGDDEEGKGVLKVAAKEGSDVTLESDKKMLVQSDEAHVDLLAENTVAVKGGESKLDMDASKRPDPTLALDGPAFVKIGCSRTTLAVEPAGLKLTVPGNPESKVDLTPASLSLSGGSLAVVMEGSIEQNGGGISFS